ncbi:hypothetical protein [Nonomuraea sp. CA-141351]|uniref:hypothetical protein n=1 Tax=Nonomuraea sp. CA-141351 TaxID=3239996 RepID=UPI003D919D5B
MSPVEILSLLLALPIALNIAIATYLVARATGAGTAGAILPGGAAVATSLGLYFAAVAAHH